MSSAINAVDKVALSASVADVEKHLKRHDLFEDLPQFLAATQLEEYPRVHAECLPSVNLPLQLSYPSMKLKRRIVLRAKNFVR
jgi:hypothetical protein